VRKCFVRTHVAGMPGLYLEAKVAPVRCCFCAFETRGV